VVESFFGALKTELAEITWPRAAAVVAVTDYIDVFYNRRGRHSSFGYITPCRPNGSRRGAMPLLNPGAYEMADVRASQAEASAHG